MLARNALQAGPEFRMTGPFRSVESRMKTWPQAGAISTHAPLFALRLAFRH
jgi:hypothetical protein